ncbi:MAG: HslU--HslV peptidase ATPase subunit [Micavibrio sp.]|nr:HslU--HslV peptidase ATPase subunit [Micavibrio sp.]
MITLTPKEIVKELDRHIIGQKQAKHAVANALRNRWRRKQVDEPLRDEILPKNILMIGPTGVGKTEIARRIAKLANSPFIKVEATKFTEVGYVGRDVDSIIRDLTDVAVNLVREESHKQVEEKAKAQAEERLLDALVGENASDDTREKFRKKLHKNEIGDKEVEIEVNDSGPAMQSFDLPGMGGQMGVLNLGDMISKAMGGKTKTRRMTVDESYDILMAEESDKLIDEESIVTQALDLVENDGIVFIDELDKITARSDIRGGEVSREGVQRDLLPLIEGTSVSTKYGIVKTDHILFISSGAFHMAKPSDLLPELQGRLPIRVELEALTEADLVRILKEPEGSLLKQYTALMEIENVTLDFTKDGISRIANIAAQVNKEVENIGARRLHTIMEKLLEDISFTASETPNIIVTIDHHYVDEHLGDQLQLADLSKFIL